MNRGRGEIVVAGRSVPKISVVSLAVVVITAVGGFTFWWVAARRVDDDLIGEATALVSSALFVAFVCNLGVPLAIGRYATTSDSHDAQRFALGAIVSSMAGITGATIYLMVGPARPGEILDAGWGDAALWFVAIAGLAPLVQVLDVRLLALGRFRLVILRPIVTLAAKIVAAVVVIGAVEGPQLAAALFCALLLPEAMIGAGGSLVLSARPVVRMIRRRAVPAWWGAARAALLNYGSLLLVQGTMLATPVVVLASVTPASNADFYLAWSLALIALVMTQAVMWGLHIEGERDDRRLAHQTSKAIELSLVLGAALTIGSLALVPLLPAVYGAEYLEAGRLAPLAVSTCIPYAVNVMILTEARVRESFTDVFRVSATFAVLVFVPVLVVTPSFGSIGAVVAVVAGATAAAVVNVAVRRATTQATSLSPLAEHA